MVGGVREDTEFEWWQHDESGEEFKVKRTGIGEHELELHQLHKGRTYLPLPQAARPVGPTNHMIAVPRGGSVSRRREPRVCE